MPEHDSQVVVPPGMEDDPELQDIFTAAADASRATYTELLTRLEAKFADQPNAVLRRKQARQAARAVLPNATETRIVVTGNYRAWRHFIAMRASEHADVEIRQAGDRVPAPARRRRARGVRRLRDLHAGRRHRGGHQPAGHGGLTGRPIGRGTVRSSG